MFSEAESAAKEKMCSVGDKGTTAGGQEGTLGQAVLVSQLAVRDGA